LREGGKAKVAGGGSAVASVPASTKQP